MAVVLRRLVGMRYPKIFAMGLVLLAGFLNGADKVPQKLEWPASETGKGTAIELWARDKVPSAAVDAEPEIINQYGRYQRVSFPTMTPFFPEEGKKNGVVLIVLPGGGYGSLDWPNHVTRLKEFFLPRGVTVVGLKYRLLPKNERGNVVALLDAQRAVRLVRAKAKEWGVDANRVGVLGYSAGANLAMLIAGNFDGGNPQAEDVVERFSSRPDFVTSLCTWAYREKESPFVFKKNTPPVFLAHARDDSVPWELSENIRRQLVGLEVPVKLWLQDKGGHGAFHLMPSRDAGWAEAFMEWLKGIQ